MSEQQTIESVHASPVQILANHTLITSLAPAIEKPIRAPCPQVNSRARAEIQDCDLCGQVFGPMELFDVKVSAGDLREKLHDPQDKLCQKPVGIIEDYGEPR